MKGFSGVCRIHLCECVKLWGCDVVVSGGRTWVEFRNRAPQVKEKVTMRKEKT